MGLYSCDLVEGPGHYDDARMKTAGEFGTRSSRATAPAALERLEVANGLPARVVSARATLPVRLAQLWQSRELLGFLVRKELKVKYKGSALGFLWSMLNPAIVLGVYYVVFKYFLHSAIPDFALFLFSGLIVWNFFGASLQGSASSVVGAAGIVKKVSFPREVLPLAQVGTALVFFALQSVVLVIFLAGFQFAPAWRYLPLVAFGLVDLVLLAAGVGIFLAAVNVYLRDIEHLIAVLLQAWFWGVPIIYSFDTIWSLTFRHHLRWLLALYMADPITPIVLSFQRAIYGRVSYPTSTTNLVAGGHGLFRKVVTTTATPVLAGYSYHFFVEMLALVFVASLAILFGALTFFGRVEGNFAEEL